MKKMKDEKTMKRVEEIAKLALRMSDEQLAYILCYAKGLEMGQTTAKQSA